METQERVRHLAYRCQSCNRLITKLELLDAWTRSERDGVNHSICPCGSGRISPTNPTLLEELFLPRVWKLWWKEVVQKRSA